MNEKLMEVLVRDIVSTLPDQKKELYRFIVRAEDELARQCHSKEQFMSLLTICSPYQQAAEKFHLSLEETWILMNGIEDEITAQLDQKLDRYKWIDFTENRESGQLQFFCIL
ncbi:hypothetical protein CEF21_18170 [Bacillus sp. FJAT-42376]|uniref:hypothetical protein n=1 Tax=Bacillus sp. FJAT-42376 TaxID=2014076 RepID=UPI000F509EC8|nr:hypothetical protein [Bacillus sp. FJAT-42376]AZB44088.1 hypothetical protein CEF21_18170 [Bacillus sp. FJAT-42376]